MKYLKVLLTLLIVVLLLLYAHFKWSEVKENGIIGIAKITGYEPAESGSHTYIDIYYNKKIFKVSLSVDCEKNSIGKFYFIKFNPNSPSSYPILFCDKNVSECISIENSLYKVWDSIPCKIHIHL